MTAVVKEIKQHIDSDKPVKVQAHKFPLNQIKILHQKDLETPVANTAKWHLQHKPYSLK